MALNAEKAGGDAAACMCHFLNREGARSLVPAAKDKAMHPGTVIDCWPWLLRSVQLIRSAMVFSVLRQKIVLPPIFDSIKAGSAMAGRPKDPDTDFRVLLHVHRSYRYAATQPYVPDPENPGKMRRRYVFWGSVTEDLRFIPNERFLHASEEERARLIFPKEWNMSEASGAPSQERSGDGGTSDGCSPADAFAAISGTVPVSEQSASRLCGAPWLLWEIARKSGLLHDLRLVFPEQGERLLRVIMTVSMHQLLAPRNCSIESWQRFTRAPSASPITRSDAGDLLRLVTGEKLGRLFSMRIERQKTPLIACITEVPAPQPEGIFPGSRGKGSASLAVLYSADGSEPVCCRLFSRGESLHQMVEKIRASLAVEFCCAPDVILVCGSEGMESIMEMQRRGMRFIARCCTSESAVSDCLRNIRYESTGLPADMEHISGDDLWCAQFRHAADECRTSGHEVGEIERIILYLDMHERLRVLTDMHAEMQKIKERTEAPGGRTLSDEELLRLSDSLRWHRLKRGDDGALHFEPGQDEMEMTMLRAGFYSLVSSGVDADAAGMLSLYAVRVGQEKYLENLGYNGGALFSGNSSDCRAAGRLLISFISMMLHAAVRKAWRSGLREKGYESTEAVIAEMTPIRCIEDPAGSGRITAFTDAQKEICAALGLTQPDDAQPGQDEAAGSGKETRRRPGRPRSAVNRPKQGRAE